MNDTLFARTDPADDADIRALATIDPAGPRDPEAHTSPQATRVLADLTSSPRERAGTSRTSRPRLVLDGKARPRRWVWVAAAAAVMTGGLVLTPNLLDGGAYASWTDVPAAATAKDAAAAEEYCRDMWLDTAEDPAEGLPPQSVITGADMVIAEQRGEFTYTVLSDGTWSMDCLVQSPRLLPLGWAGSAGGTQPLGVDPVPDGVADVSVAAMGGDDIDGLVLMMYGRVGGQVRDVVVHVPEVGDVEATVTNGYVAAWAPGLSEAGFTDPGVSLTLYLQDGSRVDLTPEQVLAAGASAG